ncbi:ABC transporter permease subunit [Bosea thiooxidans]
MAHWRGGRADLVLRVGAIAGFTIPSFWLGIVMLIATATLAPSFASLGYVPFGEDPLGNLQRLLLPAIALALPILANLSRLVRTAMLDALGQTISAPPAPRGWRTGRALSACPAQRADPLRHQRRHHDRLSARRRDRDTPTAHQPSS